MSKQEHREQGLNNEGRAVALFDIDGTLTKGFAIVSFAKFFLNVGSSARRLGAHKWSRGN